MIIKFLNIFVIIKVIDKIKDHKTNEKRVNWPWFIFWSIIALYAFFSKAIEGIGFIVPSLLALLAIQHTAFIKSIKIVFTDLGSLIDLLFTKIFNLFIAIAILIFAIWSISKITGGILNLGKYEGQTAKDWYYDYEEMEDIYYQFRECAEEYDNLDLSTKLEYGGVINYCD